MAVFHGLASLALVVFLAGAVWHLHFWLGGAVPGAEGRGRWRKAAAAARQGSRTLVRLQTMQVVFWNGLIQRQLWRESPLRWLMHVCLSWSFVGLFFIGSFGNLLADLGVPLEKDDHWFAALNDFFALTLLLGLVIALGRRFLAPKPHTRTLFEDAVVLVGLAVLALSGLLLEATRYLDQGTPATVARYAFLGYPLSQVVETLDLSWARAHDWLWWTHALFGLGLVAYLPYSKLFHMFASPATIVLTSTAEGVRTVADEVTA